MATGAELIAAERQRQIESEGWTPEHDRQHTDGQLARAAACYAFGGPLFEEQRQYINGDDRLPIIRMEAVWPWEAHWYKPKERIADLVRAGALIAAEIDRLQAAQNGKG